MQNPALDVKRNEDGSIDIRDYARAAAEERRLAKCNALRTAAHGGKRAILSLIALIGFWNIPPLGGSSKEMPFQ